MTWFDTNRSIVRVAILALFIVSLLGPWTFDLINVPAEYECDKPFVRLEGDFCGYPLSGFFMVYMFTGGLFNGFVAVLTGTFTGQAREFLMGLFLFLIIPFFTTLVFHDHQVVVQLTRAGVARYGVSYECSPPVEKAVFHGSRAWALTIIPLHGQDNLPAAKVAALKAGLAELHG